MSVLGLTPEQLAERRLHIHAGDATALMAGDYRKVYRRIKGLDPEDDLSGEFRVQLGSYTEPFGLWWTEKMTGRHVDYYSGNPLMRHIWKALSGRDAIAEELVVSQDYPFMAVNLDASTYTAQGYQAVLDAKHLGRSTEAEILRYTPAGVFQATVCGTDWWGIAPIVGNKWEPPIFQEVDPLYQAQLIARARECWGFIERDEEPPELTVAVAPPKPQPKLRTVSLDGGDYDPATKAWTPPGGAVPENWAAEFVGLVYDFASTYAAHTKHNIVREEMKRLVPEGVGTVLRGRFKLSKDKAGAVRLSLARGGEDAG